MKRSADGRVEGKQPSKMQREAPRKAPNGRLTEMDFLDLVCKWGESTDYINQLLDPTQVEQARKAQFRNPWNKKAFTPVLKEQVSQARQAGGEGRRLPCVGKQGGCCLFPRLRPKRVVRPTPAAGLKKSHGSGRVAPRTGLPSGGERGHNGRVNRELGPIPQREAVCDDLDATVIKARVRHIQVTDKGVRGHSSCTLERAASTPECA